MIELRWLDRPIDDPTETGLQDCFERVLQYRERMNPDEMGLHPPIWSDWQDVPTVTEAS